LISWHGTKLWQFLDSIGYHEKDLLNGKHDIEKIFSIIDIISIGFGIRIPGNILSRLELI